MLFSSTVFIYLFLPFVLVGYYCIFKEKRKAQNIFLLCASILFYAWGEPKFVLIMLLSIAMNWFLGLWVDKEKNNSKVSKLIISLCVIFNLAILFIFKYLNFTETVIEQLLSVKLEIPLIRLPIGISFFTFQAMSYVIDVYSGKGVVQKSILNVGLYISFFPQLIAGPIVRYQTVADEIMNRHETIDEFYDGFNRFILGLSKKVLLANSFAILADRVFDDSVVLQTSIMFHWLGAIAYALQIFFDFSGYSDMAIGLGKMFGFHFLENFDYPYIATSISEFWRRWHISLGTWFRDYLYIPLGGSHVSVTRNIFNLFVVWSLTGIWHGANYTFIVWGLMYFVLISAEKTLGFGKRQDQKNDSTKLIVAIRWIYTQLFVLIGWVIFRSETIFKAKDYLFSMFGIHGNQLIDPLFTGYFKQNLILLMIGIIACTPAVQIIKSKYSKSLMMNYVGAICLICLFVLSLASLLSSSYNPFIYFNF